jgi:hypothetical protein
MPSYYLQQTLPPQAPASETVAPLAAPFRVRRAATQGFSVPWRNKCSSEFANATVARLTNKQSTNTKQTNNYENDKNTSPGHGRCRCPDNKSEYLGRRLFKVGFAQSRCGRQPARVGTIP